MTDPLTALRDVPVPARLDVDPIHARIDELAAAPPRRRRRLPALALVAAALAAATVVLTTGGTPTTTQPSAATAATVLHALGKRVAATPAARLGPGEYYAVRVHQYAASGKATDVEMRSWTRDGKTRDVAIVAGKERGDGGRNEASFPDLSTLPTEPAALAARMRELAAKGQVHPGSEPTPRDYLNAAMQTVFDARQTPPAVLRGIYEFLATLPGIRLIGDVTDPLGRPGKAVAVDGDPVTNEGIGIELIVAPETGEPLAIVHYRDGDVNDPWLYTTREEGVVDDDRTLP